MLFFPLASVLKIEEDFFFHSYTTPSWKYILCCHGVMVVIVIGCHKIKSLSAAGAGELGAGWCLLAVTDEQYTIWIRL